MSDEAKATAAPPDETAKAFAARILEETKARSGKLYEELSKKERKELESAVADLAQLQLNSMLGIDVSAEIPVVKATIQNYTVSAQVRVMRHLRDSLSSVIQDALAFAFKVIPAV